MKLLEWTKKPPLRLGYYWFRTAPEKPRPYKPIDFSVVRGPVPAGDGLWELHGMQKSVSTADMQIIGEWWPAPLMPPTV